MRISFAQINELKEYLNSQQRNRQFSELSSGLIQMKLQADLNGDFFIDSNEFESFVTNKSILSQPWAKEMLADFSTERKNKKYEVNLDDPFAWFHFYDDLIDSQGEIKETLTDSFPRTVLLNDSPYNSPLEEFYGLTSSPEVVRFVLQWRDLNHKSEEEQKRLVKGTPNLIRLIENPTEEVINAAISAQLNLSTIEDLPPENIERKNYLYDFFVNRSSGTIDVSNPNSKLLLEANPPGRKYAIVTVDVQEEFLYSTSGTSATSVKEHISKISDLTKNNIDRLPQIHVQYGRGLGFDIDPSINRGIESKLTFTEEENNDGDSLYNISKSTDGAFSSTNIAEILKKEGVTDVIIMGLNDSACVEDTMLGALANNFNVITSPDIVFNTWDAEIENSERRVWAYQSYNVSNVQQIQYLIDNNLFFR
jgi:nicotinamidase-related amidase